MEETIFELFFMKIDNLKLYYGMDIPSLTAAQNETGAVVLQDYHPLVQDGVFDLYFNQAHRFIYWNCCKVPRTECDLSHDELIYCEYQAQYDCYILDLKRTRHRQLLIDRALKLAHYPGIQGFFVDDLDVYCSDPHKVGSLVLLFEELENVLPLDFKYIYNRGFAFWARCYGRLAAIVLENVGPLSFNANTSSENSWLQQRLSIHIPLLRLNCPDVTIFYLDYMDSIDPVISTHSLSNLCASEALTGISAELNNIKHIVCLSRNLDLWPEGFSTT
jgi:hypothetical protein